MLGKLIKYEWKGFRIPLLIMIIVLTGTTALTCSIILTFNPDFNEVSAVFSMLSLWIVLIMYYFSIIGCSLGIMLIVAVRFYKTCYTDQGYLTHTLPVSTQKILNVKIVSSVVVSLLMILAIAASVIIVLNLGINYIFAIIASESSEYTGSIEDIRRLFSNEISLFFSEFKEEFGISFGWYIAYFVVYCIVAIIANIMTVFGCVSLGQLYAKHRIIGAIIAYLVVKFIMNVLRNISTILMYSGMYDNDTSTALRAMSPSMNLTLLFQVVLAVVMYFSNLYIMTKKLNLE